MPRFHEYIGIDYSGAKGPKDTNSGLRAFVATAALAPVPLLRDPNTAINWSRQSLAEWLVQHLTHANCPAIVAIDHAFSFPLEALATRNLASWDQFLRAFRTAWPTQLLPVEALRQESAPWGNADAARLCEKWTSSTKRVFAFEVKQGNVAFSTHAGLPWLLHMREAFGKSVHFWPFDGFEVADGKSVVAEVYPALFNNRYETNLTPPDAHDAYCIANWLKERDQADFLTNYFNPLLLEAERGRALLEGWILGLA